MTASPHQRAGLTERGVYARRLAVAAFLSGLVHLLLWNGLSTTRLSLLGGTPRDATTQTPVLKPKRAADFPLQVSKSPISAEAAHERPLDMQVAPRQPPEMPRTASRREQPPAVLKPEPEQPLPVAVTPPPLARPAPPRDTAAEPPAVDTTPALAREQLDTTVPQTPTQAADMAATPGVSGATTVPQPAPLAARDAVDDAATVSRRRPREVAMPPAASAAQPPSLPLSRISGGDAVLQPQPAASASRRTVASPALVESTESRAQQAMPISPAVGMIGSSAAAAAADRPQAASRSLADPRPRAERGTMTTIRGPTAADPVADESPAKERGTTGSGLPGLVLTRPPAAQATAGGGVAPGMAAAAMPLARTSPAAARPAADDDGTAATIPLPTATTGGPAPAAEGGGTAPPSPVAISRLGSRTMATAQALTGAVAATARAEAAGEELSSVAEVAALSAGGAGAAAGVVAGDLSGRDGGDDLIATAAPQPLGRVAAVTLPVEGRVREIAVPFARRSRANRDAGGRERPEGDLIIREKTRAAADSMVDRGLEFLVRAQQPDGRWRLGAFPGATAADTPKLSCDTAATGLAILSFLGAGHDHFGGPHRDTVRRGLEFLLSVQKPDGDLYLSSDKLSDSCAWLYSHGIATMALCEAVGMTGDPLIKPAAARACGFITASQHPDRGGWRYTPRSDADLSVSGWMLVALRSGRLAGIEVEPRSFDGVKTLLDASAIASDEAKYHYNPRNPQQRPSQLSAGCMTAVGTLMRLHTGWTASDPRVQKSARALASLRPAYGTPQARSRDCYLWYYASQVLVHTGGDEWTEWYDQLAATLEQTQERDGPRAGSWDPLGGVPDRWGQYGGRIYVTALHLLALEVPDRRLPTYGSPNDAPGR